MTRYCCICGKPMGNSLNTITVPRLLELWTHKHCEVDHPYIVKEIKSGELAPYGKGMEKAVKQILVDGKEMFRKWK